MDVEVEVDSDEEVDVDVEDVEEVDVDVDVDVKCSPAKPKSKHARVESERREKKRGGIGLMRGEEKKTESVRQRSEMQAHAENGEGEPCFNCLQQWALPSAHAPIVSSAGYA